MSTFDEASLVFIPSGYKTSKAYSVKPTDGSGDLAFTRSNDTATRVGPDGLIEKVRTNLALYSEQFDNAGWLKGTLSVTANAGTAPDGTTTADLIYPSANSSNSVIFNGITVANSTEYTNSIYVKASGKTWVFVRGINDANGVWFDLTSGVVGTQQGGVSGTITSVGSGWYRCSVTQTSTSTTGRIVTLVVDGNGSTSVTASGTDGLLIWGAQQEAGVMTDYIATTSAAVSVGPVANVPRLDYLGSSCPRLLLEPQRTNLVTYSEQLNTGSGGTSVVTANTQISPDGFQNADTIGTGYWTKSTSQAAGTYTLSVFAKYQSSASILLYIYDGAYYQGSFNLQTGVATTSTGSPSVSMVSYGNGWYRCIVTATTASTISEVGFGSGNFYGYGLQLEAGAYATSYVPTLGAAVTRGADAASKTSISSLIGQTEGTIFIELGEMNTAAKDDVWIELSDGTTNNRILIYNDASGNIRNQIKAAGTISSLIDSGVTLASGQKIAITYKTNEAKVFINGVQRGSTDTSVVVPTVGNLYLSNFTNTIAQSRTIAQALLFKTALSDADCIALTA